MVSNKIKPYEISVWADTLDSKGKWIEEKIAIIGSSETVSPQNAVTPTLTKNVNGEITLSFKIPHTYYDEWTNEKVINPLEKYLVNERKIKLLYKDEWYDFIIKDCDEESEENYFSYTCKGLFVNELSKVGYSIVLSADLSNNTGNVIELGNKAIKGTDWIIDEENSDIITQLVAEPLYVYSVDKAFSATNMETEEDKTFDTSAVYYFFYSQIKNLKTENIQFICNSDTFTYDDNNVATAPNYMLGTITHDGTTIKAGDVTFTRDSENPVNLEFQGNRLAYSQRTTYDPITERQVFLYESDDGDSIYEYTDYEYATSETVVSYVTNGTDFNVYSDGTMEGWSGNTHGYESSPSEDVVKTTDLSLVTYPSNVDNSVFSMSVLPYMEGFLKYDFVGEANSDNDYSNTIYNAGVKENVDLITNFIAGDKYVFRARWGCRDKGSSNFPKYPEGKDLHVMVAKYELQQYNVITENEDDTDSTVNTEVKNLYVIDWQNPIIEFNGDYKLANNIIDSGEFNDEKTAYIKDNVIISPSLKYVYYSKETTGGYIWDGEKYVLAVKENGEDEIESDNYLPFMYTVGEVKTSISNSDLSNSVNDNIGIFLYFTDDLTGQEILLSEVQLFKYYEQEDGTPVLPGNVPQSKATETKYFYKKPKDTDTSETIIKFANETALKDYYNYTSIEPVYNENYEKILSVDASQSNCYNIIQSICEAFECWAKFTVEHEENGAIKLDDNGAPIKKITFKKYVGKDNFAGFKYGINLKSIKRELDSSEFVSKLIVEQVSNDTVDGGTVSIAKSDSNISRESTIYNFSYYKNQGLIGDVETFNKDFLEYQETVGELNTEYQELEEAYSTETLSKVNIDKSVNVYTELIEQAKEDIETARSNFKEVTGITYEDYASDKGFKVTFSKTSRVNKDKETVELLSYSRNIALSELEFNFYDENYDTITLNDYDNEYDSSTVINTLYEIENNSYGDIKYIALAGTITNYKCASSLEVTPKNRAAFMESHNIKEEDFKNHAMYTDVGSSGLIWDFGDANSIILQPSEDNETLIKIIGEVYTCQNILNTYPAILTNLLKEQNKLEIEINGYQDYYITVARNQEGADVEFTNISINDYFPNLIIKLYTDLNVEPSYIINTSVDERIFNLNKSYSYISFSIKEATSDETDINSIYEILESDGTNDIKGVIREIPYGVRRVYTLKHTGDNTEVCYIDKMADLLAQKQAKENEFYKKYSRFIQEGTWTSNDYVDNDLYYYDALKVSNTSAQPKITYTLEVAEISEIEGFQNYDFEIGDKTYIEDPQFFGYNTTYYTNDDEVITQKTPIREEVVVTEAVLNLENPQENTITIQNYKTQFADLFQRISATVQTVEYNSASYARAASILDTSGLINSDILTQSLNASNGSYSLGNSSVQVTNDGLLTTSSLNTSNKLLLSTEGILASSDSGATWDTLVSSNGVNVNKLTTGNINIGDNNIIGYDGSSLRWDEYGINAYGMTDAGYDLNSFVRFDKYGLYGINDNSTTSVNGLSDIKSKASFGLTWDGFFIKNSYTDGYVSISSDNDFQVMQGEVERIKIGNISNTTNTRYGMIIRNSNGDTTFETDENGDVTVSGKISANTGKIAGFTIEEDDLVGTSENGIVTISPNGISLGTSVDGITNQNFYVTAAGDLFAQNATIAGTLKTSVFEKDTTRVAGGTSLYKTAYILDNSRSSNYRIYLLNDEGYDSFNVGNKVAIVQSGFALNETNKYYIISNKTDEYIELETIPSCYIDNTTIVVNDENEEIEQTNKIPKNSLEYLVILLDEDEAVDWTIGVNSTSDERAFGLKPNSISMNEPTYNEDLTVTYTPKVILGDLSSIEGASGSGLYAQNVYLTGNITAESGKIAGFTINENSLSSSDDNGEVIISPSGIGLGTEDNIEDKKFYVSPKGDVYAESITLKDNKGLSFINEYGIVAKYNKDGIIYNLAEQNTMKQYWKLEIGTYEKDYYEGLYGGSKGTSVQQTVDVNKFKLYRFYYPRAVKRYGDSSGSYYAFWMYDYGTNDLGISIDSVDEAEADGEQLAKKITLGKYRDTSLDANAKIYLTPDNENWYYFINPKLIPISWKRTGVYSEAEDYYFIVDESFTTVKIMHGRRIYNFPILDPSKGSQVATTTLTKVENQAVINMGKVNTDYEYAYPMTIIAGDKTHKIIGDDFLDLIGENIVSMSNSNLKLSLNYNSLGFKSVDSSYDSLEILKNNELSCEVINLSDELTLDEATNKYKFNVNLKGGTQCILYTIENDDDGHELSNYYFEKISESAASTLFDDPITTYTVYVDEDISGSTLFVYYKIRNDEKEVDPVLDLRQRGGKIRNHEIVTDTLTIKDSFSAKVQDLSSEMTVNSSYGSAIDDLHLYKCGNAIHLAGVIKVDAEKCSTGTPLTIATLPASCCPITEIFDIGKGGGTGTGTIWRLQVTTGGNINMSHSTSTSTNHWINSMWFTA